MWTLAEASVECRVMSGATAAGADDASYAEKRKGAGGGDGEVQHRSGFRAAEGTVGIHSQREFMAGGKNDVTGSPCHSGVACEAHEAQRVRGVVPE